MVGAAARGKSHDFRYNDRGEVGLVTVVMTVFETWALFPRALECVLSQSEREWELLVVSDGPCDASVHAAIRSTRARWRGRRVEVCETERADGCWGNRGRALGLALARGERIVWVNHDNLIAPEYLATHVALDARRPGCVGVVDIELWQQGRSRGRYPRGYRTSRIDLLNYSLPVGLAREIDAFGPGMEREYAADGRVFEEAARRAGVERALVCLGVHF